MLTRSSTRKKFNCGDGSSHRRGADRENGDGDEDGERKDGRQGAGKKLSFVKGLGTLIFVARNVTPGKFRRIKFLGRVASWQRSSPPRRAHEQENERVTDCRVQTLIERWFTVYGKAR